MGDPFEAITTELAAVLLPDFGPVMVEQPSHVTSFCYWRHRYWGIWLYRRARIVLLPEGFGVKRWAVISDHRADYVIVPYELPDAVERVLRLL